LVHKIEPELRGVPRVVFCQEYSGVLAVGETVLTGQSIAALLRPDNFRDFAFKVTAWLAELAGAGQPRPSIPAVWRHRLVEPVLRDFDDSFGPVIDRGMLRETENILNTLGALPLVCEQRDCGPWNMLMTSEGELAVLDWESSEPEGLPALDLIYFVTYLSFFISGVLRPNGATASGRFRECYRMSLDPSARLGSLRSECLSSYANDIGANADALRPLALLAWLVHSRSEYRHFFTDTGDRPAPELLRQSLFVGLWEEELRWLSSR
jgi:hypothetical protein